MLLHRWKWKTLIATKFGQMGRFLTVVVDGQTNLPSYAELGENSLVFSGDGARMGYVVGYDRRQAVVIDGKPHRDYFGILQGSLVFSPNGKRVAYIALDTLNRASLVVDGYLLPNAGSISDSVPLFSPDSKHIAYTAFEIDSVNGRQVYFVVFDSAIGQRYEMVYPGSLVFSQDGSRLAYVVKRGRGCAVIVDEQPGPEYDTIQGQVVFSSDGKRYAYAARWDSKSFAVVDGQEGPRFDTICTKIVFSPDGGRMAYGVKQSGSYYLVKGDLVDAIPGIFAGPLFSTDGKHLAYGTVNDEGRFVAVVDGKVGPGYGDGIVVGSLTFSPDGNRVAYTGLRQDKKKMFIVCDDKAGPEFDWIASDISFSANGQDVAHVASIGQKWFMVINDETVREYDGIVSKSLTFGPDNSLVCLAIKKKQLYRVQITVKNP
jgi:roadblock/LC7 domain-containing protein